MQVSHRLVMAAPRFWRSALAGVACSALLQGQAAPRLRSGRRLSRAWLLPKQPRGQASVRRHRKLEVAARRPIWTQQARGLAHILQAEGEGMQVVGRLPTLWPLCATTSC